MVIKSVEKIDFTETSLRVGGIIIESPEDIPKGSHHTFNLQEKAIITIINNIKKKKI